MPSIRKIEEMGIADSTRRIESADEVEVYPELVKKRNKTNKKE